MKKANNSSTFPTLWVYQKQAINSCQPLVMVIDFLQLQRQRKDPNAIYGTVEGEGIYATADEGIYEIVT